MSKNQKSNAPRRERLNGATCTAEVKPEVSKNPDVDGNVIVKRYIFGELTVSNSVIFGDLTSFSGMASRII